MTDEQIIKALEYCATDDGDDCFQCPYGNIVYKPGNGGCVNRCRKEALDLINRQKEEIERLKKNIDGLNIFTKNHMKVIRLQAIKEFAERLKSKVNDLEFRTKTHRKTVPIKFCDDNANWVMHECIPKEIDKLVKEMTEE